METPDRQSLDSNLDPNTPLGSPYSMQITGAYVPGTRQPILITVTNWLSSKSSKILWLADISGSDKSAVARHIAYTTTQSNQLLCSFFFECDIEHQASTLHVIPTMAHELARVSGPIAAEIAQAGSSNPGAEYVEAFHSQITAPLNHHPPERPSLILINALDESGSPAERAQLLDALIREVPLLPLTVKVMLTSKPTQDIDAVPPEDWRPLIPRYQFPNGPTHELSHCHLFCKAL